MTEQDAKSKWCPMTVASHTNPRQIETDGTYLHNCIGSACALWQWDEAMARHKTAGTSHSVSVLTAQYKDDYEMAPASGRCGLTRTP